MATDGNLDRIIAGRYRLRRTLGSGAHGTVYLAEDLGRGAAHVALKLVEGLVGGERREAADDPLRRFRHPHWASVLDSGSASDDAWFQALEFVAGTSLDQLEGPQPADLVYRLLEDGARVLGAMHRQGLIHYDVTPGNLILGAEGGSPRFVLTDGGLAHVGPVEGVARGTPLYMAPEVTEDRGHDFRADLYSLGLVAFRLATGRDAFEGGAGEVLGRRRREDAPRAATVHADVPAELDALLAELLARNPKNRPHDAFTLLERIGAASGRDVPRLLDAESTAAAEGGALVGRATQLERFGASMAVLRARIDAGGGRLAQARTPALRDPVLLLHGAPGSGCTRASGEMMDRAREAGVPALLMSGREATGNRHGPLRYLVDGMAALELPEDAEPNAIRLGHGDRETLGREERSHSVTRAVEQFLRGVEVTAKRTPFVLIVQDFGDLPPRAQEAIRVLSRHLLGRRESGGGASAPPILLVTDVGSGDVDSLLVPDAEDPERPLVEISALSQDELQQFASARFPGLEPTAADREHIAKVTEGLPGVLAALLAEGRRRGDLRYESGGWSWNVDRLEEYSVERGLSPVHADALRAADDDLLRLLAYTSLVESPLEESIIDALWSEHSDLPLPSTPLLRSVARDDTTYYTTSTLALKGAVLKRLGDAQRAAVTTTLLTHLEAQDSPDTALDRARLHARAGSPLAATALLHRHRTSHSDSQRRESQPLLRDLVTTLAAESMPRDLHASLVDLLDSGPEAAAAAVSLASALPELKEVDLDRGEALLNVLWASHRNAEAAELSESLTIETSTLSLRRARTATVTALVHFRLQQEERARESLTVARKALREIRHRRVVAPGPQARYLMAEAQAQFLAGNATRAHRLLTGARISAAASRLASLEAQVLNNQGIVLQQLGRDSEAEARFRQSLELRESIGDVKGVVASTINLGRLLQHRGDLVRSASLLQSAAGISQRYGHVSTLSVALRLLADAYDQQLNTRLAATTLARAHQMSKRAGLKPAALQIAWSLAPISAAIGDLPTASQMLLESARAARNRETTHARATHYLTAALTALHSGHGARAATCFARAIQRREQLYSANRELLAHLCPLLAQLGVDTTALEGRRFRPAAGQLGRESYRAGLWLYGSTRARSRPQAAPGFARHVPRRGRASGGQGRDRRVLVEALMRAATKSASIQMAQFLVDAERQLAMTGERVLEARVLALRSTQDNSLADAARAQVFSRAVARLEDADEPCSRTLRALPDELARAYVAHSPQTRRAMRTSELRTQDAHALAHRMLLRKGVLAAPDQRVANALRSVLSATGRMNAGGGLDDLLQGMTNDTLEITGADRTCVVLLDSSATVQLHVEKSAAAQQGSLELEDLSQTVIQRVMDSATPLLLHDVFDDQELMGRPSITGLSLRSILCVPMIRGECLFGVLYADSASAAGSFDQVDQEVLSLFAEQAAAALETHRLVADLQNSMGELKAMQERLVRGERLRTMGELSSGVAHEFNNLLTSILARVQLISLNPVGFDLRRDLELIEKACLDAAEVVRRLQSFTKHERQGGFVPLDMGEICREAVEFLRPLWSTRRRHGRTPITVRVRADSGLPVAGNPTELREVITNLVKNALDALADGGHIDVRAGRAEGLVEVVVEDDGPGIPLDIQSRIFDPFFTTKGERGTGLGLCLSQQIIERHGGELALNSHSGMGTRFLIELPELASAEDPSEPGQVEPSTSTPRMSVLIIDDDDDVRHPLARFLEKSGYQVMTASDGREGVSLAEEHRPDIVISDVSMPGLDGIKLCAEVSRLLPDTRVILISGRSSATDPARARRAGAAALLAKPFALQQITETLRSLAGKRSALDAESGVSG